MNNEVKIHLKYESICETPSISKDEQTFSNLIHLCKLCLSIKVPKMALMIILFTEKKSN